MNRDDRARLRTFARAPLLVKTDDREQDRLTLQLLDDHEKLLEEIWQSRGDAFNDGTVCEVAAQALRELHG